MDRGIWWATVHKVPKSQTQLGMHAFFHSFIHIKYINSIYKYLSVHIDIFTYKYIVYLGEGNGNPLQYSCQANPMDGGAW